MPRTEVTEKEVKGILKYKSQILMMKKIIDEIMEPTEEEKKYKEKHKKDMGFPKSFDEPGKEGQFEWYEREFGRLAKDLSVIEDYYNEKTSLEACMKAWEDFKHNVSQEGYLEDIQKKTHSKYAIGDGEYEALTNPRVRRMVRIADTLTDLEALMNALYEREKVKDIQEKAQYISVTKKTYLNTKKEFAEKFDGIKIQKKRETSKEQLVRLAKLAERNLKLENLIKTNQEEISNGHIQEEKLTAKLKNLNDKKLEYDTERQKWLKEVNIIKAYRQFNKMSREIRDLESNIEILKGEEEILEDTWREKRIERKKLVKELIEKKDPLVEKYKDIDNDYVIVEEMMKDAALIEKHKDLYQLISAEYYIINASSDKNINRRAKIEDMELKVNRLNDQIDTYREIIKNGDRPDLENATDSQLSNAQNELNKYDDPYGYGLTRKNLDIEIEETTNNIQGWKEDIVQKEKEITDARREIEFNKSQIEQTEISQKENQEVVEKAGRAIFFYNQYQSSKQKFVDSMKGFNFGEKVANRIIDKANGYNLKEGTRFMHKNTPEFMTMDNALEQVQKCDPNDRGELKNRLKALEKAATEYRAKKLKDGGFNTGMRNTRLTKAQNLITMCQLGIQELSAVPEKKEKVLSDYKKEVETSLDKKAKVDAEKNVSDLLRVDEKLDNAHKKADTFDEKLQNVEKRMNELDEIIKDNDDFSMEK